MREPLGTKGWRVGYERGCLAEGVFLCDRDAEKSFRVSGLVTLEAGRRHDVTHDYGCVVESVYAF